MKPPQCRTSCTGVNGQENCPNSLDLDPVTLAYDLWPLTLATLALTLTALSLVGNRLKILHFLPWLSDLGPHDLDLRPILSLGWNWNFHIFDLDSLDLWPWVKTNRQTHTFVCYQKYNSFADTGGINPTFHRIRFVQYMFQKESSLLLQWQL